MKKLCLLAILTILLCGCGAKETMETVADVYAPQTQTPQRVVVNLPTEAALQTAATDGKLYICDGYTLTVQTLAGGDLNRTVKEITGYAKDKLSLVETRQGEVRFYRTVFSCVGEGGDHIARAVIMDDGVYHYAVTVMAPSDIAWEKTEAWQEILGSVSLRTD